MGEGICGQSDIRTCTIYFVNLHCTHGKWTFTMHDFAKLHVEDWAKRHGLLAGIALLFAATLAWLGAFGSHDFEPFARVGDWPVIFLVQYGQIGRASCRERVCQK